MHGAMTKQLVSAKILENLEKELNTKGPQLGFAVRESSPSLSTGYSISYKIVTGNEKRFTYCVCPTGYEQKFYVMRNMTQFSHRKRDPYHHPPVTQMKAKLKNLVCL